MTPLHLTADRAGERVDQFLARTLPELTRSAAQRLLEEGAVTRGGGRVKKNDKTAPGDVFTVVLPDPAPIDVLPQKIPLDVIYEDGDVIVVNKPVGLVVHPAPGHPDHSLYREYEAVCVGNLKQDAGTVRAPIARHPTDRKRMAVDVLHGREAVTHWTVLERLGGYTHIQCRLETGRTHQIRVHMAKLGHPLLGDTVYGAKKPYPGLAGQCLHARRLSFTHPRTGRRMTLECPLPPYFAQVLTKLRQLV